MRGGKWAAPSSPLPLMHPVWLARGWVERAARLAGRQTRNAVHAPFQGPSYPPMTKDGTSKGEGQCEGRGVNPDSFWEVGGAWEYPASKRSIRTILALGPSRKWETVPRKQRRPCWLGAQSGPDVWLHDLRCCKYNGEGRSTEKKN